VQSCRIPAFIGYRRDFNLLQQIPAPSCRRRVDSAGNPVAVGNLPLLASIKTGRAPFAARKHWKMPRHLDGQRQADIAEPNDRNPDFIEFHQGHANSKRSGR
jgi:hypothetical protein